MSGKQIRTLKSVLEYIFLAIIDNCISHMGQFELKLFFFCNWVLLLILLLEMKNDWGKNFIIWVILRHGKIESSKSFFKFKPTTYIHITLKVLEQKSNRPLIFEKFLSETFSNFKSTFWFEFLAYPISIYPLSIFLSIYLSVYLFISLSIFLFLKLCR